jgi:hypothetical protein
MHVVVYDVTRFASIDHMTTLSVCHSSQGYHHQLHSQFMILTKPVQTGLTAEYRMKDFFNRITNSVKTSYN